MDRVEVTPHDDVLELRWSDAEERLQGSLRPTPPRAGRELHVSLDVGSFEGVEFRGPLVLTLREAGATHGESRTVTRGERHWEAVFVPENEGPHLLDVSFRTTRNKVVHAAFDVSPSPVPRILGLLLFGGITLTLLGFTVRSVLRGERPRPPEPEEAPPAPAPAPAVTESPPAPAVTESPPATAVTESPVTPAIAESPSAPAVAEPSPVAPVLADPPPAAGPPPPPSHRPPSLLPPSRSRGPRAPRSCNPVILGVSPPAREGTSLPTRRLPAPSRRRLLDVRGVDVSRPERPRSGHPCCTCPHNGAGRRHAWARRGRFKKTGWGLTSRALERPGSAAP